MREGELGGPQPAVWEDGCFTFGVVLGVEVVRSHGEAIDGEALLRQQEPVAVVLGAAEPRIKYKYRRILLNNTIVHVLLGILEHNHVVLIIQARNTHTLRVSTPPNSGRGYL